MRGALASAPMTRPSLISDESHAITVVGHDRPGIIAEVTGALADLGGNLEDSSMTLLRGHFAWTLIVTGSDPEHINDRLEPLRTKDLQIFVVPLPRQAPSRGVGVTYLMSVHGGDRPGIVSTLTRVLAAAGGNIVDLTTRLSGDLYVLVAEVVLPEDVDIAMLELDLGSAATNVGVGVTLRPEDTDLL